MTFEYDRIVLAQFFHQDAPAGKCAESVSSLWAFPTPNRDYGNPREMDQRKPDLSKLDG